MGRIIGDIGSMIDTAKFRHRYESVGREGEQLDTLGTLLRGAEAIITSPAAIGLVSTVRDAFSSGDASKTMLQEAAERRAAAVRGEAGKQEQAARDLMARNAPVSEAAKVAPPVASTPTDDRLQEIEQIEKSGRGGPQLADLKRRLMWLKENMPEQYASSDAIEYAKGLPEEELSRDLSKETASGNVDVDEEKRLHDMYEFASNVLADKRGKYTQAEILEAGLMLKTAKQGLDKVRAQKEMLVQRDRGAKAEMHPDLYQSFRQEELNKLSPSTRNSYERAKLVLENPRLYAKKDIIKAKETISKIDIGIDQQVAEHFYGANEQASGSGGAYDAQVAYPSAGPINLYETRGKKQVQVGTQEREPLPPAPEEVVTPEQPKPAPYVAGSEGYVKEEDELAKPVAADFPALDTKENVLKAAAGADTPEKQQAVIEAASKVFRPRPTNIFEAAGFGGISRSPDHIAIAQHVRSLFPKTQTELEREKIRADIEKKQAEAYEKYMGGGLKGTQAADIEATRDARVEKTLAEGDKALSSGTAALERARAAIIRAQRGGRGGGGGAGGMSKKDMDFASKATFDDVKSNRDELEKQIVRHEEETRTLAGKPGVADLKAPVPSRGTHEKMMSGPENSTNKSYREQYEKYQKELKEAQAVDARRNLLSSQTAQMKQRMAEMDVVLLAFSKGRQAGIEAYRKLKGGAPAAPTTSGKPAF